MLKAILFDLDETLLNWTGRSVPWQERENQTLGRVYRWAWGDRPQAPTYDQFYLAVLAEVGRVWGEAKEHLRAPHLGHILVDVLRLYEAPAEKLDMEACLAAYGHGTTPGIRPYPDAAPALRKMQALGLRLGLITNAMHPMKLRDVELVDAGLLEFFAEAWRVSAADVGYLKPHPRIFQVVLERMDCRPEEAVFVGDSLSADIAGAQAVGMKAIWRRPANLKETYVDEEDFGAVVPDAIVDSLAELHPILCRFYPELAGA
jgi:putative hydrolase of the HAD superfamily